MGDVAIVLLCLSGFANFCTAIYRLGRKQDYAVSWKKDSIISFAVSILAAVIVYGYVKGWTFW